MNGVYVSLGVIPGTWGPALWNLHWPSFPRFFPGHPNHVGRHLHPSTASVDASWLWCSLANL